MKIINSSIFDKPSCKFKFLDKEGFNIPNFYEVESNKEVLEIYKSYIDEVRDTLPYDIDGLVEEVNDYNGQSLLGYEPSGLIPKFATAIKFDSITATSTLREITWSVGSTGRMIPIANFDKVELMGVTLQKATLHNVEFLEDLIADGLEINSEVIVARANDVIPQVLGVKHAK